MLEDEVHQGAIHNVKVVVERIITLAPEKQVKVKNKQPKGPWTPEYAEPKITTINIPTSDTWWAQYMTVEKRPALSTLAADHTSATAITSPEERSSNNCLRALSAKRKLDKCMQELLQEESDEVIREVFCRKKGCCRFLKSKPPTLLTPSIVEMEDLPSPNVVKPSTLNLLLSGARYMNFSEDGSQNVHDSQLILSNADPDVQESRLIYSNHDPDAHNSQLLIGNTNPDIQDSQLLLKDGNLDVQAFALVPENDYSYDRNSQLITSYCGEFVTDESMVQTPPILPADSFCATNTPTKFKAHCTSFSFDIASPDAKSQIKVEMHTPLVDYEHTNSPLLAHSTSDDDANSTLKSELHSPIADPTYPTAVTDVTSVAPDCAFDLVLHECSAAESPLSVPPPGNNATPSSAKGADHSPMNSIPAKVAIERDICQFDPGQGAEHQSTLGHWSDSKCLAAVKSEPEDHQEQDCEEGAWCSETGVDDLLPTVWVKSEGSVDGDLTASKADCADGQNLKNEDLAQKLEVTPAVAGLRSFRKNKEHKSAAVEGSRNTSRESCILEPLSDAFSLASLGREEHRAVEIFDVQENITQGASAPKLASEVKLTSGNKSQVRKNCDAKNIGERMASRLKEPKKHEKILDLRCPHCPFTTNYRSVMTKHNRVHKTEGVHYCPQCDMSTRDTEMFRSHLLVHYERDSYTCEHCDYTTLNQALFTQHVNKHKDKTYSCTECSYTTGFRKDFQYHQLQHSEQQVLKCSHCAFVTKYQHNFKQHVSAHTGKDLYFCDLCPFFTAWDRNFSRHMTKHKLERTASNIEDAASNELLSSRKTPKTFDVNPMSLDGLGAREDIGLNSSNNDETNECSLSSFSDEHETTEYSTSYSIDQHNVKEYASLNLSVTNETTDCLTPYSIDKDATIKCLLLNSSDEHESMKCTSPNFCSS